MGEAKFPAPDFGVELVTVPWLPPDKAYLVSRPLFEERMPVLLTPPEPPSDWSLSLSYAMRFAMPKPPRFVGIDFGFDDYGLESTTAILGSIRWRLMRRTWSRKRWQKWQRELDWTSNVRRQKRKRELARRRAAPSPAPKKGET
jgi:hypothetical protein